VLWKFVRVKSFVLDELPHDDVVVGDILRWEEKTGNYKLINYVNSPDDYNRILQHGY